MVYWVMYFSMIMMIVKVRYVMMVILIFVFFDLMGYLV